MSLPEAIGPQAARLLRRKRQALSRMLVPPDALPGSLALTSRRCGKPSCHCAGGEGHPSWSLTFMAEGHKRVEHLPADWVEEVRPLVEAGRSCKQALADLFVGNVELLILARKQRRRSRTPSHKDQPS